MELGGEFGCGGCDLFLQDARPGLHAGFAHFVGKAAEDTGTELDFLVGNEGSTALFAPDKAGLLEVPESLADGGLADLKVLADLVFRGQAVVGLPKPLTDPILQDDLELIVK